LFVNTLIQSNNKTSKNKRGLGTNEGQHGTSLPATGAPPATPGAPPATPGAPLTK